MRALTGIDVAFLPMNLPYTMSGEQAASAVKAVQAADRLSLSLRQGWSGAGQVRRRACKGVPGIEVRQRDWYAYG